MQYIHNFLEIDDEFRIISENASFHGTVHIKMKGFTCWTLKYDVCSDHQQAAQKPLLTNLTACCTKRQDDMIAKAESKLEDDEDLSFDNLDVINL